VMVGLFLAMLELIRNKLVSVEQPASTSAIYLRALTDEPAEQAVQNAILAVSEAENAEHNPDAEQAQEPPIPLSELPAQEPAAVSLGEPTEQPAVPIAEISSEIRPITVEAREYTSRPSASTKSEALNPKYETNSKYE